MEPERAEGIVLRAQPVTESSLIVTWFTREAGKLKTLAKGARRPKSPLRGKLDLFYRDEILWLRSRRSDLHLLHDCFVVNPHARLRDSVVAVTAASHVCELVEIATVADDPEPVIFDLLAETLPRLGKRVSGALLLWFELRLLAAAGWRPPWNADTVTGKVLRSLATGSAAGAERVRLTEAQLDDARQAVWRFWDEQAGRVPRTRRMVAQQIQH